MTSYNSLPNKPLCECGAEMECIADQTGWECDANEAWHTIQCNCPKCGREASFCEVYAHPRYELLHRYKEGE